MPKEYIEREALKEDLKESYDRLRAIYDSLTYDEDKQICAGQLTAFTEAILRVKDAPAADVAPVRPEQWEKHGSKWQCTGCKVLMSIDGTPQENLLYYCPNCGAKMDKKEE